MKLGGYAHTNGITFFCDVFKLKTTTNKGKIKQQLEWIIPMKWLCKLENKPIIGGVTLFYYQWKIFDKKIKLFILTLISLMILDEYVYIPIVSYFFNVSIGSWWIWAGWGIYLLLNYRKMTSLLRYHGAEHKVINCFLKHGFVEELLVKESPRFNKRCGTNLAMIFLLFYGAFYFLNFDSMYLQILIFLVAIQIFKRLGNKETRVDFILNSFQWLTVWEPREDEIRVAIEGFTKLHHSYLIYQREVMIRNRQSKI